jgi:hypothetical protein
MTAETDLLPLPEWAACDETVADMSTTDVREAMNDYARACVSSATEALRDQVDAAAQMCWQQSQFREQAQARAERLAEALQLAHKHLDMTSMRVSHCKDAAIIDAALEQETTNV